MPFDAPCRDSIGTVLLVEDEDMIRVLFKDLLEWNGYGVVEAVSGEEALALADAGLPPLAFLVTDHTMAGMDGCETVARLRARVPGLRSILVSGLALEDCLRGRTLPDTLFLAKPFTIACFEEAVRTLMGPAPLPVLGREPATALT